MDTGEVIVLGVYSTAVIFEDKTVQANISDTALQKKSVSEAVEKYVYNSVNGFMFHT